MGIAVSGQESCDLAGRKADLMIATEPKPELGEMFDAAGGTGKARVGQIAVSYDTDKDAAIKRAHEQFRWFGLGWKVNSDLPGPSSFEAATQFVTPEQVAGQLPCGNDVDEFVREDQAICRGGLYRDRAGADRRGTAGNVHSVGGEGTAAETAPPLVFFD